MKKAFITLSVLFLAICRSYAQQTVTRSNQLTPHINEQYSVLKTNKKLRDGNYTATYGKNIIAKGDYKEGKRIGIWHFYGMTGALVQTFNYDNNSFNFVDMADVSRLKYFVDGHTNDADTVVTPVKIGGWVYSLLPLVNDPQIESIKLDNKTFTGGPFVYTHTFTVNETGDLIRYQVMVNIKGEAKTYTISLKDIDPELTRFIPASVNGKPAGSIVTVTSLAQYTRQIKEIKSIY